MAFMNALQSQMGQRPQMNPQMQQRPPMNPPMQPPQMQQGPGMYGGGFTGRGLQMQPQFGGPQSMGIDKGGGPPQMMAGQGGGMGPSPQMIQQMMMMRRPQMNPGMMPQRPGQ